MGKALDLILLLGWLAGCFPSRNPFPSSKNFGFKWHSPITVLCLLLQAYFVFVSIDLNLSNDSFRLFNFNNDLLSHSIILYVQQWTWCCGDVLCRGTLILSCRKIIGMVQCLQHLSSCYRRERSGFTFKKVYLTCTSLYLTLHLTCTVFFRIIQSLDTHTPLLETYKLSWQPANEFLYFLALTASNFIPLFSFYFSVYVVIYFGATILEIYEDISTLVIHKSQQMWVPELTNKALHIFLGTKKLGSTPLPPCFSIVAFKSDFALVRSLFEDFGRISGILIFVTIGTSTVRIISVVCTFLFRAGEKNLSSISIAAVNNTIVIVTIISIANFGQLLRKKVRFKSYKVEKTGT
jgi:hypothetical protein